MTSILEKRYTGPKRPYSQNELKEKQADLYKKLRLSNHKAFHEDTRYFYRVKVNSRKEREIIETGKKDVGNCSISWKISKTPRDLKSLALDLVNAYCENFDPPPKILTYRLIQIENDFYNWLYENTNRKRYYNN